MLYLFKTIVDFPRRGAVMDPTLLIIMTRKGNGFRSTCYVLDDWGPGPGTGFVTVSCAGCRGVTGHKAA